MNIVNKHPLLTLQAVGWLIYLVADSLDHLAKGYYNLFPSLICAGSAFVVTGLVAWLTNKLEHLGTLKQNLAFSGLILLAAILWHKVWAILHDKEVPFEQTFEAFAKIPDYTLAQWLTTGYYPLFLFLAWSGVFFAAKWYFVHKEQQEKLGQALLNTRQAQLQTLRYQLNPHFLFNVLNSVDVSVLKDDKQTAHQMLQHLSGFLRHSLEQGEQDKIPLSQEMKLIRDFINIEQLRFKDALLVELDIADECEAAMLPPMLLQPLMENAIKFAWSYQGKGVVSLNALKQGAHLVVSLCNSTSEQQQADKSGTGTGLRNTRDRLMLVYGDDADLSHKQQNEQFIVTIKIPMEVAL